MAGANPDMWTQIQVSGLKTRGFKSPLGHSFMGFFVHKMRAPWSEVPDHRALLCFPDISAGRGWSS